LMFLGFAFGRLLSVRLDGRPNKLIIRGLIVELAFGSLNTEDGIRNRGGDPQELGRQSHRDELVTDPVPRAAKVRRGPPCRLPADPAGPRQRACDRLAETGTMPNREVHTWAASS
jgi:hypothetical protein